MGKPKRKNMQIVLYIFMVLLILGVMDFIVVKMIALKRFGEYESKSITIDTTYGKLAYIDEGAGEPILSVHGICGGYDQAYDTMADRIDDYRIIAPSRFGYPGSDMPDNATIEMQVEAFCELLDSLKLNKVFVLATSAGSTSAIRFTLMYPERVKGLILYCAGYPGFTEPEKEITLAGPPGAICNDFVMWLISPLFKPIMGMDRNTIKNILPMKDRKTGIVFDGKVTNTVMYNDYKNYDLSAIKVPVLIIHAKDDELADYESAKEWSERIPQCTLVTCESGGHLMSGNREKINRALDEFVIK